ncbi:MAG: phosphohexomutase domain-containing protein [Armatimonadota bacterium]
MISSFLTAVRRQRESLIASAFAQDTPPIDTGIMLHELTLQSAQAQLDDRQLAHAWGEWQLLLVNGEGRKEDGAVWQSIRQEAATGLIVLLNREAWGDLRELLLREIAPRLSAAVTLSLDARMQACIEATTRLRSLAGHPAGRRHSWLLRQVADMQYPRFGTSGWRARMGVDFTWRRATAVAQAIIEFVLASNLEDWPLSIGYDSRINGDRVADLVAEVAVANGLDVHLASRETPSPALIYYITEELGVASNAGLINCTPSHNPVKDPSVRAYLGTEYHGIRYNMPYGAVAPSRATDTIGRRAMELLLEDEIVPTDRSRGVVMYFDPLQNYVAAAIDDLSGTVVLPDGSTGDALAQLRNFWGAEHAMVVIDEMHSASRGYLRLACDKLGIRYTVLHGEKDPLLGELMYANPEPPHISRCMETVRELRAQYPRIIGLGVDTDSDRFGVVDEQGRYVLTNQTLPMLADYLLTAGYNGQPGKIIRNMVTTRLLDRVAAANEEKIIPPPDPCAIIIHAASPSYHVSLGDPHMQSGFLTFVVPVGFKYIADVMMDELQEAMAEGIHDAERIQRIFHECLERLLVAGEESNGFTSRGHTPDKDGLWGALLTLQMCAVRGQTISAIEEYVFAKYGKLVSVRRDVEAPNAAKEALVNVYLDRYKQMAEHGVHPDPALADFIPVYCGGVRDSLVEVVLRDADGRECYLAIRASGTEPINRIYVECPEEEERDEILQAVGVELEHRIIAALAAAPDIVSVVDLLEAVELPPADGRDLPATYTNRIIGPAIARIREITGSTAEESLQVADEELSQRNPAKAGTLQQYGLGG